jgi:phage terminase small subunit
LKSKKGTKQYKKIHLRTKRLAKMKQLTIKEEKATQSFMIDGNKTEAYKSAYSTDKMKPSTINRKAHYLFNKPNVKARIEYLREEIAKKSEISIIEIVKDLAGIVKFDVKSMYDEEGKLLTIDKMPIQARKMITRIENVETKGKSKISKITLVSKMDAVEKLMRHLGGYEKDKPILPPNQVTNTVNIYELPNNGRN